MPVENDLLMTLASLASSGMLGFMLGRLGQKVTSPRTAPAKSNSKWHPMPCGTRLELGASGYWINLLGKPGKPAYVGYDPEGDVIASGPDLKGMKGYLEQQADYREEFAPPAKGP